MSPIFLRTQNSLFLISDKLSRRFLDVQLMQDELGIDTDGPLLGRKYTFLD